MNFSALPSDCQLTIERMDNHWYQLKSNDLRLMVNTSSYYTLWYYYPIIMQQIGKHLPILTDNHLPVWPWVNMNVKEHG